MTTKENIYKQLAIYKNKLEELGYKVLYIGLYGSQNYNLDDELSDIDVKAIVLPTLEEIIFRKQTSKVIECENGSIDVKDLITFYDVIKKGNFSYIESIDIEYSIGDKYLKGLFSQFRPNFKSMLGAMYEKRKALTPEFPSKKEEFTKWGFDPKQHHHILRLYDLLDNNITNNENKSFICYEDYNQAQMELLEYKRNKKNVSIEIIQDESDRFIALAKLLIPDNYQYEIKNIDEKINTYITNNIKLELLKNHEVLSARQYRTFGGNIPNSDLKKFPILKQYDGQDISYIVYESVEVI